MLVIYMVGCAFGLLYADGIILIGVFQVALQLMLNEKFPDYDLRNVSFIRTMLTGKMILKPHARPSVIKEPGITHV